MPEEEKVAKFSVSLPVEYFKLLDEEVLKRHKPGQPATRSAVILDALKLLLKKT